MTTMRFGRILATLLLAAPLALAGADDALAQKKKKGKKGKKGKGGDAGEVSYEGNYGMAGCGLGSVIIKQDTTFMQITAGTTNDYASKSSALSCTGSSNCKKPDAAEQAQMEQEVFIAANMRSLEADLASGGGDYAYALAQVLGCDEDDEYDQFLDIGRDQFETIFASSDPKEVRVRFLTALRANPDLAARCERIDYSI